MARPYRVMARLITWRKTVGGKTQVPFDDAILTGGGTASGAVESLLRDVLEGLQAMNGNNWGAVRRELESAIRDECAG